MTLEERAAIIAEAESSEENKKLHLAACAGDPIFFCNTCLWVNEPRHDNKSAPRDQPYILRDFQEDAARVILSHIKNGEDIAVDKTREMGVTWLVLWILLHGWLFESSFLAILTSITEDKIDRHGDLKTLFGKLDYLINSLLWSTPWVYPEGYKDRQPYRTHMNRFHPSNRSHIAGEVMGPNLGRSGRSRVMFMDEFAEAAEPEEAWASSSRTTDCRVVVYTPQGMNFIGKLVNQPPGKPPLIDRISLHWKIDPTKNRYDVVDIEGNILLSGNGEAPSGALAIPGAVEIVYPWYKDACTRLANSPSKIAAELNVDYSQSVEGSMYPQISRSRITRVDFDPAMPLYCSMDYGLQDECAFIWAQWDKRTGRFRIIDSFKSSGKTIRWYIPFLTGSDIALGEAEGGYNAEQLEMIVRHGVYFGRYHDFYGDPAGRQRNQVTATSVIDVLRHHGIHVRTSHKANSYEVRKHAVASALPFTDFDEIRCHQLIEDIRNSRQNASGTPLHSSESHFRSALEYLFVNQPHGIELAIPSEAVQRQEKLARHLSSVVESSDRSITVVDQVVRTLTTVEERIAAAFARRDSAGGQRGGWGSSGRGYRKRR